MLRYLLIFALGAALSACGRASEAAPLEDVASAQTQVEPAQNGGGGNGDAAQSASALQVSEANDVYEFNYSYPSQAGAIRPLKAVLDSRMEQARDELVATAIDARADADAGGYPYHPYSRGTEWQVVANLPDWLSLSANLWEFTGGAHGNSAFDTLLWDKRAGEQLEPLSLFTSTAELEQVVQGEMCKLLDRQREQKRGAPVQRDSGYGTECIGVEDTTVILGSSNRRTFDRIGFLIAPYTAGPYAEGSYEVTLPVTGKMIEIVKPEFRDAFSVVR